MELDGSERKIQAVSIFSTATPVIMGSDPWPKARIGRGEIRTISDLKFRSSVQTHHAQGQRSSDRPIKAASAANTNLGGGRFWHASAEAIFNPTSSSNSCVSRSITAQQRHHHLIAARIFQKSHSRPNITILSDHGKMGSRKSEAHLLNSVSASHGVRVSVKHGETAATQSNSNTEHTSRILILAIRPGHPKLRSKPSNTRFDLKGSSQGRCVSKEGSNGSTTFKDLDLDVAFYLNPSMCEQLLMQIKQDCDFLEAEGIMDYSLLLGVHIPSASSYASPNRGLVSGRTLARRAPLPVPEKSLLNYTNQEMNSCNDLPLACPLSPGHKLGEKVAARAVRNVRVEVVGRRSSSSSAAADKKEMMGREGYDAELYLGMIDILQGYNVQKRVEHAYKSLQFDSQSISAVNPRLYSKRFQDFLSKAFTKLEWVLKNPKLGQAQSSESPEFSRRDTHSCEPPPVVSRVV
ncbi:hypothetical protein ACLOJK_014516 [Asimina triloba]